MRAQMELMSSLLFFALVAHLPQVLGNIRYVIHHSPEFIKFNTSKIFHQFPMQKKILLNINGPPLVNVVNKLQMVFMDMNCKDCLDCMERAIKAYKTDNYNLKKRPRTDELHAEVLQNRTIRRIRNKREAETTTKTTPKTKKSKSKKKTTKSVTVTKYNVGGDVFGLKVKETNIQSHAGQHNDTQVASCLIYSVKKTFPCDTPESDSFLTGAKRKVSKKSKKEKDRNKATTTTTEKPHFMIPAFRKREVDNSQIPENFMPSIEELY